MLKKLFLIVVMGVSLSGCFMAPLAFIGPVTSGFSTASLVQSGVTTTANYMVKKSTGKTILEYSLDQINKDILQQTYFPQMHNSLVVAPYLLNVSSLC